MDDYPLFVYGTLLRGQPNHYLLKGRTGRIVCGWIEDVEMYSMGTFPMMVEGRGRVLGEVVYLRPGTSAYAATLALLDRLERVDGSQGLYRRVLREVTLESGQKTPAWVYLGQGGLTHGRPKVTGGDWVAFLPDQ